MIFGIGNDDKSKFVDLTGKDGLWVADYNLPLDYPSTAISLTIVDNGTVPAGTIRRQIELETLLNQAGRFMTDRFEIDAVWLYARPEGQDRTFRKLIVGVDSVSLPHRTERGPFRPGQSPRMATIGLRTMPMWEEIDDADLILALEVHGAGAAVYVPAGGTVPGRIKQFSLSVPIHSSDIGKIWAGIIPDYRQDMAAATLDPKWLMEDSTPRSGYSLVSGISGSIGVNVVRANLSASSDMHGITHVQRGWRRGNYLLLLRYRFAGSSGDRAMLKFESGYFGTSANARIASQPVYISNTDTGWKMIPLGVVSFPLARNRQSAADDTRTVGEQVIAIQGKRLAGSNYLYLDTLTYIPADTLLTIEDGNLDNDTSVRVLTYPDDTIGAYHVNATSNYSTVAAVPRNWVLPTIGGMLMVATAGSDGVQDKDNEITFSIVSSRRWQTYQRGIFTP